MNIDKEREFFDAFESDHGDYDVLADESYRRILSWLPGDAAARRGRTGVDLGCGTGAFTRRMSAAGLAMTGLDISPRSIQRANALGGGIFVVGDIMATGLPAASFDYAVMSGVLHHLPHRELRVRSLREARRLLRPGGRFFSYDPNAHSPSMWLYRDPRSPLYSSAGKTENEVLLSGRELTSELRSAGFSDIEVRAVSGIRFRYVEGAFARRMLPFYNYVYEPLVRWSGLERHLGTFLVARAVHRPPA